MNMNMKRPVAVTMVLWHALALVVLAGNDRPDNGSVTNGGYIVLDSQTFREDMPISGTPYSLSYSSARCPGFREAYRVYVQFYDEYTVSPNLVAVEASASIAGRGFNYYAITPNLTPSWELLWDGRDSHGQLVAGKRLAAVRVGSTYVDDMYKYSYKQIAYAIGVPPGSWAPPSGVGNHEWSPAMRRLWRALSPSGGRGPWMGSSVKLDSIWKSTWGPSLRRPWTSACGP